MKRTWQVNNVAWTLLFNTVLVMRHDERLCQLSSAPRVMLSLRDVAISFVHRQHSFLLAFVFMVPVKTLNLQLYQSSNSACDSCALESVLVQFRVLL